jgi:hypothetical protein
MAEIGTVLAESREFVERIGSADLVLGIPTYQNRETVRRVVEAGVGALTGRLDTVRAVVVNADGGSKDGTPELLREAVAEQAQLIQTQYPLYPAHKMSAPLPGVPGKREAVAAIFSVARTLGAKACTIVDATLETTSPEWVERLSRPVLEHGADLVSPYYQRSRFDGLITGAIVYPFTRALYGKRVRQPLATDLGFSAQLVEYYLSLPELNGAAAVVNDPFSCVPALCGGFQSWQTSLGPRTSAQPDGALDLSDTLAAVLSLVFEQMDRTAGFWQKVRGSMDTEWYGPVSAIAEDETLSGPPLAPMVESFRLGCRDLHDLWSMFLPPATLLELRKMSSRPDEQFVFRDDVWARTVYDFALGYHMRSIGRDHLVRAVTTLYLGWVASFVREMQASPAAAVDQRLEQLAMVFEGEKRYLISRWRWPDRFNP